VVPLGSSRAVKVDVRVIAATNRDLEAEVREGRFRSDLYYRLNVVPILLPALRERRDDIPLLADEYIRRYSDSFRVAPKRLASDALEELVRYDWPGNVRELQNVIERCFALGSGDTIDRDALPGHLRAVTDPAAPLPFGDDVPSLEATERALILAALRKSGGNKNQAARILGIDRQRLYRKLEKYHLE
jgi:DNA-binding NtrC family response regulator